MAWIDAACRQPEDVCTSGLFVAYYAIFIGPAWGFVAGTLGAIAGINLRSRVGYGMTMALLASPVLVFGVASWAAMATALGLIGLTYVAATRWISPTGPVGLSPRFTARSKALESAYLASNDPIEQSGFHGGRERWIAERSPLVDAIHRDGTFLDVGCANGMLAADVVTWAREKGHEIVPHGVDLGARLVDLARERLPEHAANFVAADAWTWEPDRRWTFVYSLLDLSPQELWCQWLHRLHRWVEPGGRLIIGSYGSRSRGEPPVDVTRVLEDCGLAVSGSSAGGEGPVTRFAWVNRN